MEYQSNNSNHSQKQSLPINRILNGDCIDVIRQLPAGSIDFILTDPPYLVNYKDRSDRSIQNDNNVDWLRPATIAHHHSSPYAVEPDAGSDNLDIYLIRCS